MEVRRLNEQEIAQVASIIAPIAAEYTPNFPRDFCEVTDYGVFNLHCTGVEELGQRLVAVLTAAGFAAVYRCGSIGLRAFRTEEGFAQ